MRRNTLNRQIIEGLHVSQIMNNLPLFSLVLCPSRT
jgi:hypothetical protein